MMEHTDRERSAQASHLLDEHRKLRAVLGTTREFLENPRPDPGETGYRRWAAAMSKRLVDLSDGLGQHFREEESCGVFQDLARRYPRSSDRVEHLQDQHESLLGDLRELMSEVTEYSTGIASDDPRLRRKLVDVLNRVDAHEHGETELIQRMLYNDIGEGE